VLTLSSSSYRQSFCFLVRKDELPAVIKGLEEALALELEHHYIKPIQIDENVGLIAVVGEGMRGVTGLAGRIFTAVSQEGVSVIAIAQGSSEMTINLVVQRADVEKAVKAIHAECELGAAH
jgi:bifunctional aspartokinase / homoserine dehydrogenase 1